ncbi:MAG: DHHW family protein [Oscillospiraceae bacterium]|nr:DHHW family protein [Oscillospiraceae bacterium]
MKKRKHSEKYIKAVKNSVRLYKVILPCVFIGMLVLGLFVSLLLPLRPSFSENEKRELASFPSFSFSSLFDGSFFRGIDAWFSDTFPFRDAMISANEKLESLRGFGDRVYGLNNEVVNNNIPPTDSKNEPATESTTEEKEPTVPEQLGEVVQKLSSLAVVGSAGYEYCSFNQSVADKYASVVNKTAQRLSGKAKVCSMLVPTSIDITMPDSVRNGKNITTCDQKAAMEYIYGKMSSSVTPINIYKAMRMHRDEYIYFRTDHHWTALGAYYAYEEFAKVKNFSAITLDKFEKKSFGEFLGSFYTNTNSSAMKKNPDELYAYMPPYKTKLQFTQTDGKVIDWFLVNDTSSYPVSQKYSAFTAADNPYTVIENLERKKGKTCVIIKESFANAVIPYIVYNYKKVYVIDYRYYKQGFISLAEKVKANDVVFINNMSAVRSESLIDRMSAIAV